MNRLKRKLNHSSTVGENIIATTKILNNYGAIKSFKWIAILDFPLLLLAIEKRAKTIAIAIVGRSINIWEVIQKRSHERIYKTHTKT